MNWRILIRLKVKKQLKKLSKKDEVRIKEILYRLKFDPYHGDIEKMAGEKNVFVCIGDGTYLMNPSDLIVAAREKINMTVCLFVNHGYQIIRALQVMTTGTDFDVEFRERQGQGEKKGDFLPIDFAKHAESLGARVHKASTGEALSLSLNQAKSEEGLSVVVIEVDPYEMSVGTKNSFWDIAPPMVSRDPEVNELRRSYEEQRDGIQRYYL